MNDTLPFVVANFKANQTWDDLDIWLETVGPSTPTFTGTIIVCPSAPFISEASRKIKSANWQIQLGIQDISRFEQGAFTGEVAASQIADQVSYAIIGHSERRHNFGEDDEILAAKVDNALKVGIIPIFCIEDSESSIPENVKIVAYEPAFAIGTGNPDTPKNAQAISQKLKARPPSTKAEGFVGQAKGDFIVLYGGSVNEKNAKDFLNDRNLDGLLIGSASLDPDIFLDILKSAT